MDRLDIIAKIFILERSYNYHLAEACRHDDTLDYINDELDDYRNMLDQTEV